MAVLIPFIIQAVVTLAITAIATLAMMLLFPPRRAQQQSQSVPKPADGKFNQKQNVPSLTRAYGRVKKAGDFFFLEERNGQALSGTVMAGHRIHGYVQHYLHDEPVTISGGHVTAPSHFVDSGGGFPYIAMDSRLGLPLETAYSGLTTDFSSIWTVDHRGDGLASVLFNYGTASAEKYADVYPQQMPQHSAVLDGALVFDPRGNQDPDDPESWAFSTNLALIRLDHLTHVSGGKLAKSDLYLPDWAAAADRADEVVLNRTAEEEPRYHGALWYRYSDDQVEVGRLFDEAGEMVLYERADGKIGVHPGQVVAPDVRITEADILSFRHDANRRTATNVLAVRGRFTDPDQVYNTVDAAIWGDPYAGDDTQRTKTVDNQVVQYHNHMQRLQKLAFLRANAPRVSLTIHYDAFSNIRNVRYRRFVTVHHPARGMDEALVEIVDRPKLSLRNLTYTFDGIVVPAGLYDFDPATEEGAPSGTADEVVSVGVPVPVGFDVGIESETVSAGAPQGFAVASWTHVSDALTYELQYQVADASKPPQTVISLPGDTEVRTPYLADGTEYRFRLRTKSNGANSLWTSYVNKTTTSDAVAPGDPTALNSSTTSPSSARITWANPNSPNLFRTVLYRNTANDFNTATPVYIAYGGIAEGRTYDDTGIAAFQYYWWVRSFNASGVPSNVVGPTSQDLS